MTLSSPDALTTAERDAVETELRCLADDEFVLAERYTEWQVRGPTLEADIAIANIAQDELGHARLWYDLLEAFGYDETDLIWERDPATFRHSTVVERPFETGDWADCVVRGLLYDTYEQLRLDALADSAYPPIAGRVEKVLGEEDFHREHARNWLERMCEDERGRGRVQEAVDRLVLYALTLFAPTDQEAAIRDLEIRTRDLDELREDWEAIVTSFLGGYGLAVPTASSGEAIGRDGTHTAAWQSLYEEFTETYHLLDRSEARRLMASPDEEAEEIDV